MRSQNSPLAESYTVKELQELEFNVCSKTILHVPEIELKADLFCQPIDIAIDLPGNQTREIANMAGYPLRSVQDAKEHIAVLLTKGIRTIMVRMDSPAAFRNTETVLWRQAEIVQSLREQYGKDTLTIIVDPFSVALNQDKTWGIVNQGRLDYLKTMELFASITSTFATAGADYVLALGRFEREVDVAKRTLKTLDTTASVSSFSTNTETTNAYVYADHGAYAITKQKILVANYHEMVFRALVDIYEGSELVVIKPSENLHILEKLRTIIQYPELLSEFLDSNYVKAMVHQSAYLYRVRSNILADRQKFIRTAQNVGLSAYTVSGTYFMDAQTLKRKGAAFLVSLLYERFANIASTLNSHTGKKLIIDRNAHWFLQHYRTEQ